MSKIVIINSGSGNLLSLKRAISIFNKNVIISDNPKEINSASKIFLPGVGAFKNCIEYLKKKKLIDTITRLKERQVPVLGICLGMQLLFDESYEFGISKGFGLIKGKIEKIPIMNNNGIKLKVPSIGWYDIERTLTKDDIFTNNLFKNNNKFYFIHSYYATQVAENNILANYIYGNIQIPAVVKKNNIYGCQFHPEKSAQNGLDVIEKFLEKK